MEWELLAGNSEVEQIFVQQLEVPLFIAKMLVNRGIVEESDARRFMYPDIANLHDPFLMKGMKEGVELIKKTILENKRICIYGDYDTDGISATSLLVLTLEKLGANVTAHIPHRLKEGYGLRKEVIQKLSDDSVKLLITVDCGITSVEETDFAHSLGMSVLITDHHRPFEKIPDADAVINPKQPGCDYPFKELAGVGVAFKLCQALTGIRNDSLLLVPDTHLDLVALGSVADLVPLIDENRILVKYGLEDLAKTEKMGLKALARISGADITRIEAEHIGFRLAPRINAGGRMGDAKRGLDLILSKNMQEANEMASNLDLDNRARQKVQREVFSNAKTFVDVVEAERSGIIVLSSNDWHRGVIGIVASKISEENNCPTIIISLENGVGHASCRSASGIDMMELLDDSVDLFHSYGGHEYAAGFTIDQDNIEELSKRLKKAISKVIIKRKTGAKIFVEAELDPGEVLSRKSEKWMNIFSPFGKGNSVPYFLSRNMALAESPQKMGTRHLRLILEGRNGNFEAVGFGMGDYAEKLERGSNVDIIFSVRFRSFSGPQINIEEIEIQN